MAKVTINGKKYDLRMSLWASEQIEKEYGDLKDALKKFRTERKITQVKQMFRILANAGRKAAKQPTDVTEDELDDCTLVDLDNIAKAMNACLEESLHTETVGGGEADDEPQDALAAEYEAKNG